MTKKLLIGATILGGICYLLGKLHIECNKCPGKECKEGCKRDENTYYRKYGSQK
jgi:hypothetical protein